MSELDRLVLSARELERRCHDVADAAVGTPAWAGVYAAATSLRGWNTRWMLVLQNECFGIKGMLQELCNMAANLELVAKEVRQYASMTRLQQEMDAAMIVRMRLLTAVAAVISIVHARLGVMTPRLQPRGSSRHDAETVRV
jgi:hypothetical protein